MSDLVAAGRSRLDRRLPSMGQAAIADCPVRLSLLYISAQGAVTNDELVDGSTVCGDVGVLYAGIDEGGVYVVSNFRRMEPDPDGLRFGLTWVDGPWYAMRGEAIAPEQRADLVSQLTKGPKGITYTVDSLDSASIYCLEVWTADSHSTAIVVNPSATLTIGDPRTDADGQLQAASDIWDLVWKGLGM